MSKVVYLAHYDLPGGQRLTSPAGTTVMHYVMDSLEHIKKETILISPAAAMKKLPREETQNGAHTKIVLLPTSKKPNNHNILLRYFSILHDRKRLANELLAQLEDGDTLIVYHSLALMKTVRQIIKQRKITLILQVCEIYGDVLNNDRVKNKELSFFKLADKYIFQSEMLEDLINTANKPYSILYGTYMVTGNEAVAASITDVPHKIRCVYAGTLSAKKGGAVAAAAAALHLTEKYHIHILGFGTDSSIQEIKDIVTEISQKSKCTISYDGCLSGQEYIDFISSCDVGLSTQNPSAAFNSTSFPSKILAYMANGLRVVTVRIPAVESSAVGECVYYYDHQDSESIANAIMNIDMYDGYDGKSTIKKLNDIFLESLQKLL